YNAHSTKKMRAELPQLMGEKREEAKNWEFGRSQGRGTPSDIATKYAIKYVWTIWTI
ncbi:hypothetical protein CU098_012504, partial [Rhizopus stolonifer]